MLTDLLDDPQSRPIQFTVNMAVVGRFVVLLLEFYLILRAIQFTVVSSDEKFSEAIEQNISTTGTSLIDKSQESTVSPVDDKKNATILRTIDNLKQISEKRCGRYYTLGCLKLDVIRFLDRIGRDTKIDLIYGMAIVSDPDKYGSFDSSVRDFGKSLNLTESNVNSAAGQLWLDELLLRKMTDYVRSLTLNVRLFDRWSSSRNARKFFFDQSLVNSIVESFEGRDSKKTGQLGGSSGHNKLSGSLTSTALITGGALLWLGLSTAAAIAAKALFTSLVSLVVSCFTAYKSSASSGHKSTTYEIVARPIYTHGHTAALAAEIQHEPHSAAATSSGAATAAYGRNMEWNKFYSSTFDTLIPTSSRSIVDGISSPHDRSYRSFARPIYKRRTIVRS